MGAKKKKEKKEGTAHINEVQAIHILM